MSERRAERNHGGRAELLGDEAELFESHNAHLVRVVRAATGASWETAEDACAFAWIQLLRHQPERDNVVGWLRVVAVHEVYRLWHKARGELYVECPDGVDAGEAAGAEVSEAGWEPVAQRAELHEVLAEVAALPLRRRRIFELHLAGLSYDEIAEATGEGHRAINRQITKARNRLRRDFGDGGGESVTLERFSRDMQAITYGGELVAVTTSKRAFLAPQVARRRRHDPLRRFVLAMCLFALELEHRKVGGPYSARRAELWARALLMPEREFRVGARNGDQVLAMRFEAPVEQVAERRRELGLEPAVPGPARARRHCQRRGS